MGASKAVLNRATTAPREAFVAKLQPLLEQTLGPEPPLLVYLDEAHIHQAADLGYGWAPIGERLWIASHTPGLSAKVSFYSLYFYNAGQVATWDFPCANTEGWWMSPRAASGASAEPSSLRALCALRVPLPEI
ncbi:hypothetical protein G3480_10420 [Thiorhodococcus mannitoliphagus]|uniref:Tc1-like transposase DDE domain-containing protein n=1 Tax=Thiorhodococcus mannitoliphagus TaxID=329406 RepID=A0A6P1DSB2_9GAMM|nr:hypothetical protein [Thiorhodococcus mannitoliphagus]NEX20719.1 hypothetical protein [Thiorhodococcus mannitoliphagus]